VFSSSSHFISVFNRLKAQHSLNKYKSKSFCLSIVNVLKQASKQENSKQQPKPKAESQTNKQGENLTKQNFNFYLLASYERALAMTEEKVTTHHQFVSWCLLVLWLWSVLYTLFFALNFQFEKIRTLIFG